MAVEMVRLLGGAPTPISWGELYTALQQGVVDGAENNPPSFYLSRHYEVCKYYSLDEHTQIPDVLLISALAWSKLNQQEKEWLQQAADASAQQQKQLWQQAEAEAFAGLEQAGVEIRRVQKAPFLEKVQPMYAQLQQDSTMNDYMRAIKRMKITQKQEDDSAPSN
jgi:TRAP-type C4-dicarboxylate transport system substrate-binding protein